MSAHALSHPPRLWTSADAGHRRVTWIELFFDLVFVAAVAEVGAPLAHDYSWMGLLRYSFLFLLIWWAWSGHTLYSTRFEHDDLVQRVLILLQCFIAAVMAANAKDALDSRSSAGFGAAYAALRIVLVVQYLRARRVRETRQLTTRYAAGFGAAAVLWLVSALIGVPARYFVWGLALLIDFFTPWLAVKHSKRFPPDAAHFPERFGLFTIILLGEFVAAVMRGIESQEYWSVSAATTAFLSMAFAFVLRWWYFDVGQSASERHIRARRDQIAFEIWHYSHLPLFLGIAVSGVGFSRLISLKAGEHMTRSEGWVLSSAVAVLMISLITICSTSAAGRQNRKEAAYLFAQFALTGAAILVGVFATDLHRVVIVAVFVAACTSQTLFGSLAAKPAKRAQ